MDNKPAIVKQIENSLEIIMPVIYRMPVALIFVISISMRRPKNYRNPLSIPTTNNI